MDTIEIRKKIHEYIDQVDDRIINLMYAMVQADVKEEDYELTDAQRKILDERIAEHEANPTSGATWEEVKNRVRSNYDLWIDS